MSIYHEIPAGYKHSIIGLIPEDWEISNIGDVAHIDKESLNGTTNPNFLFEYISLSDVDDKTYTTSTIKFKDAPSRARRIAHPNDIIMSTVRPNLQGFAIIQECAIPQVASTGFAVITAQRIDIQYLFQCLFGRIISKQFYQLTVGSNYPAINSSDVKNLKIPLPPLPEQQKIAEILSTWDQAIATTQKLIKELKIRNKGLAQQLLTGKKRLKGFEGEWKMKKISDIVERVKRPFTPAPELMYREIGIRSHCKGIFYKEEVTGASLGNKSVFWIQPNCFVVNIVFAWEHAIAKTTEAEVGMIASHRFPMYKPKKGIINLDYLLYYFKTARGKHLLSLASPGGAGRNKTLGQSEFAKLKIPAPSSGEQKKIVAVLSEADKEIELLQQQLDALKAQKKGLMQKLLTGQIRVNLNGI